MPPKLDSAASYRFATFFVSEGLNGGRPPRPETELHTGSFGSGTWQRVNFSKISTKDCCVPEERLKTANKSTGLRYWMLRVLHECNNVARDFSADPVHDLRVSLRRCRSMADGMMAMDPDRNWKDMKKAGKQLFQRLGDLRDVQIMMEWIEKLKFETPQVEAPDLATSAHALNNEVPAQEAQNGLATISPQKQHSAQLLMGILRQRETEHKHEARAALAGFDRKQWRHWSKTLPTRAMRVRPGSAVFRHLALERWTTARELHSTAMRNRSQVAFHTLRIGIKRFRYIVENFLPAEHQAWSDDLKHMQDLLGEVHDLDVLWTMAVSSQVFPDEASRKKWHAKIIEERSKRIEEYRQRTTGSESLWKVWRAGLPQGKEVQDIATRRMKLWAKALDPDFAHSERVARLALQLYDGLRGAGMIFQVTDNATNGANPRACLYAAALLHDVGKSEGNKGHHKTSQELIRKHGTPLGWDEGDMRQAAVVARFHCGALPTRRHKLLRDMVPPEQKVTIQLAAVLRLANALDSAHDGQVRAIKLEHRTSQRTVHRQSTGFLRKERVLARNEALVIGAEGYREGSPTAQAVAAERYLLERVLGRPVLIKPSRPGFTHSRSSLS